MVLIEEATALAAHDTHAAGIVALRAAAYLESKERYDTLVAAARLFTASTSWSEAAIAWKLAADSTDHGGAKVGLLSSRAKTERSAGRWGDAVSTYREALDLAVQEFGSGSPETAAIRHDLAMTLKYTGGFVEAERHYRDALNYATAAGDSAFAAVIYHNLGGLAHACGRPTEGVEWARQGLTIRRTLKPNPVAVAADEGALAALLIDSGCGEEAESLLSRSREVFTELLGPDHYEVAVIDGNLATISLDCGDLAVAEHRALRALSGKERALGEQHPELAPTLTTLGTIRRRQGDVSGAISFHQRALSVLAEHVAPDHPLLVTVISNLQFAQSARDDGER